MPVVTIGQVWSDPDFYELDGQRKRKHFAVLGSYQGDVVVRLLTSRQHGRPLAPPCNQDLTYPSFYLGVVDPTCVHLQLPSWLDLRYHDDIDSADFATWVKQRRIELIGMVSSPLICPALLCAAMGGYTKPRQKRAIMEARAFLGCK